MGEHRHDLLADTTGSLEITVAYDTNGSNQYLPQTVRLRKSRITTTEGRIPVVASVVGANQSWGYRRNGDNLQMRCTASRRIGRSWTCGRSRYDPADCRSHILGILHRWAVDYPRPRLIALTQELA